MHVQYLNFVRACRISILERTSNLHEQDLWEAIFGEDSDIIREYVFSFVVFFGEQILHLEFGVLLDRVQCYFTLFLQLIPSRNIFQISQEQSDGCWC